MSRTGSMNIRRQFYRRARSMENSFSNHDAKLRDFNSSISKAETLGVMVSDKQMVRELKQMATVSMRRLRDIHKAMQQAPELRLPREVMSRFVYVIFNAKLLLSRIERLKTLSHDQMADGGRIEEVDTLFDDVDFNHLLGKKID